MRREGDRGWGIGDRSPAESGAASRPSPSAVRCCTWNVRMARNAWMRASGHPLSASSSTGFTLVELVVALTISAILVGFIAMFVSAPVDAYFDQSERAALNESTEAISRSFARDLRTALPNSVRIRNAGTRSIVEMLKVETISFYFPSGALGLPPTQEARELDFVAGDTFSVFGRLDPSATTNPYSVPYLVVSNHGSGVTGRDAYRLADVITPGSVSVTRDPLTQEETVVLPAGFGFMTPALAPATINRIFVVSGPIAYICNSAANVRTLRRYHQYSISPNIPTSETSAQLTGGGTESAALATNITSCNFRCGGGGANVDVCQDTLVFEVAVHRATASGNEVIRVLEQIPLDNRL